ncbi:hypothetical protein Y1Q_0011696 [Alligator mississippiensis]|uniref:Uncharacterized protein n=1 Tax=Alligator mississippiensis TaxID=8496 RepID=A0A151M0S5_ALLMI|nr:hypothetical protein Y1Q_0011696 [Alligator mississippiensis]
MVVSAVQGGGASQSQSNPVDPDDFTSSFPMTVFESLACILYGNGKTVEEFPCCGTSENQTKSVPQGTLESVH